MYHNVYVRRQDKAKGLHVMLSFTFSIFLAGLLFDFSFPLINGEVEHGTLYETFNSNLMGGLDFVLLNIFYF